MLKKIFYPFSLFWSFLKLLANSSKKAEVKKELDPLIVKKLAGF
jgi:hypothetical protein